MRILITGGSGFIGGTLVRKLLLDNKFSIFNIDKYGYASDHTGIENILKDKKNAKYSFYKLNLSEKDKLYDLICSIKPNLIMHLAAESHVDRSIQSPSDFIESNIVGTFNLLEATRKYLSKWEKELDSRFIFHHISTDEVFGSLGNNGKFNEGTAYDPRSPYSASKASSDDLVRAWFHTYNFPTLITNCSNNFGPWQFPEKLITLVISKAVEGQKIPIYGDGLNVRDWLFVEDHIEALLLVIQKGVIGQSYCIGGNGERTNKYVVEFICAILDKRIPNNSPHSKLIEYVRDRPGHDKRYAIDANKLKNELNWQPSLQFEEGLKKTIDWYLDNQKWMDNVTSGDYQNYYKEQYG